MPAPAPSTLRIPLERLRGDLRLVGRDVLRLVSVLGLPQAGVHAVRPEQVVMSARLHQHATHEDVYPVAVFHAR
eukprot:scaffold2393_cov267-Pinguiococcus_pyrenoidosus.AAC.5